MKNLTIDAFLRPEGEEAAKQLAVPVEYGRFQKHSSVYK